VFMITAIALYLLLLILECTLGRTGRCARAHEEYLASRYHQSFRPSQRRRIRMSTRRWH
jgi:hypothetical protein